MPVVAFLLLAMVLAQRRQPFASGVVLGIVSAMKFTAWPLAALALFAARNRAGRRRPGVMFLGMLVVAGPVVVPFALRAPWAFFDNVVLFPLGLSGVNSPAASPLPGHLIVTAFPFLHRVLPVAVGLVGGAVLALYLYRRPPQTATQVCNVGGVVMAVITLLAPATRIGYLLYPINFFVWAYLFSGTPGTEESDTPATLTKDDLQLSLSAP
jgi:phosphatidylinositol alpha-1,6-mannosyltransferase